MISNKKNFKISYEDNLKNYRYKDLAEFTKSRNIPFYQMQENMKEFTLDHWKRTITYDIILVAGWYHMLPKAWIENDICLGLHASLLPELRGGAPLVWAIIEGRQRTGVTLFQMNSEVDAGPIWIQKSFPINSSDYVADLIQKSILVTYEILTELFNNFETINPKHYEMSSNAHKIYGQRSPKDGEMRDFADFERGLRFIRAQSRPYPGAFLISNSEKIIMWKAEKFDLKNKDKISNTKKERYQFLNDSLILLFDNGSLKVTDFEIQKF